MKQINTISACRHTISSILFAIITVLAVEIAVVELLAVQVIQLLQATCTQKSNSSCVLQHSNMSAPAPVVAATPVKASPKKAAKVSKPKSSKPKTAKKLAAHPKVSY